MAYTYQTKADYDATYELYAERYNYPLFRPYAKLHYNRAVLFGMLQRRAGYLINILGIQPTDKVLLVGCGFGWTMEGFINQGVPDTWGTDTSAWIQSAKTTSERPDIEEAVAATGLDPYSGEGLALVEQIGSKYGFQRSLYPTRILNEDGQKQASRNRIGQAIGGAPDWIIVEDVSPALNDADNITFIGNLKQINNVGFAILATCRNEEAFQDSQLNWKSLEEWDLLISNTIWIEAGSYRRLN